LPKKAVRLANRMAILSKFVDGEVIILDELTMASPKTKEMSLVLKAIPTGKKSVVKVDAEGKETTTEKTLSLLDTTFLLGTAGYDQNIYKSGRNLPGAKILPVHEFNAYTVLKHKRLVLTKASLEALLAPKPEVATPAAVVPEVPRIRRGRAGRFQKLKAAAAAQ
jgi:large subunit ribosomal protein L4